MPLPTTSKLLQLANLQIAAEALYGIVPSTAQPGDIWRNLVIDPAILRNGNFHSSKFANASTAAAFAAEWTVVEHISNTTTGFSC